MDIRTYVVGPLQSNSYVVSDPASGKAVVIDPGMESEPVLEAIRKDGLDLEMVLITHGHFDHIFSSHVFKAATGATVAMHPSDLPLLRDMPETARLFGFKAPVPAEPDRLIREGDRLEVGGLRFAVLETPGHTPGSIAFLIEDVVFVGDALFAGSVGRTDLQGGSLPTLLRSIHDKLLTLPDRTIVYSGHGPATSIGVERRSNPFLQAEAR